MRLLEPTLTRLVISDFLIMKTPTATEIATLQTNLETVRRHIKTGWKHSQKKVRAKLNIDDSESAVSGHSRLNTAREKKVKALVKQSSFQLFKDTMIANKKAQNRYKLTEKPPQFKEHQEIHFDGQFATKTVKQEIEEVVFQIQESARRTFKEIKVIDKGQLNLLLKYGLGIRSVGAIWVNYMLLSCYCTHKSKLLDQEFFGLAGVFYEKDLRKQTGELFPDCDYIEAAVKMMQNPYKHLARLILILNMEYEEEDVPEIPDEILENVRMVIKEYDVKATKRMREKRPLLYECQVFNDLIIKIHSKKNDKIGEVTCVE